MTLIGRSPALLETSRFFPERHVFISFYDSLRLQFDGVDFLRQTSYFGIFAGLKRFLLDEAAEIAAEGKRV
jgi:hypothetical protein